MLLLFWLPRVPMYRIAASWCSVNLWGARWICGIRHRTIGAENIPSTPHIVMSKHSSTWETLALTLFFPPLAYVAKKELLSIPFFGWGFALASPITIDRKAGTDSMQQIATQGRERFRQGFWIVVYPEGTRIRAGTRAKVQDRRRAACDRARDADPARRAQCRLFVAQGPLRKAPGHGDRFLRPSDLAGRQGRSDAHARSGDVDRR
jgi:1-acyl-sn-glycerol-3-phosphate acyltransferase